MLHTDLLETLLRVDLANYVRCLPKHLREAFKHYEEGVPLRVIENEAVDLVPSLDDRQLAGSHLSTGSRCCVRGRGDRETRAEPVVRWRRVSQADGRPADGDKSSRFQQFGFILYGTVETFDFQ
ncbi:hypothetical protein FXV83_41885 [Bradyrhizobium hipponense]|uniref:Uncharacterized protein n=1 Tax=Bradyrhizobium hipponense TaxID=2605638 RepID=A0A5S4YBB4_9BRAD|nr:hypothetical protein [Bradyrhizobium hipponense]TYO60797.1 hypothetical protein FXV83_41885 [Bradyrhizobium hipponense]